MESQFTRQDSRPRSALRAGPASETPRMALQGVNGRREQGAVDATAAGLAKSLGLFSIGLGLAQVLAPRLLVEVVGLRPTMRRRMIMRALGIRELLSGIGALTQFRPLVPIQARIAGDGMDLMLLARAFQARDGVKGRTVFAIMNVLGITVLDIMTHERLQLFNPRRYVSKDDGSIHVHTSITVNRPIEEVYAFWRDFQNLPRFMGHLESVQERVDGTSHWKAKAPAGRTVEWDAEVLIDQPNEMIAWQSLEGSEIKNSGSVRFNPAPGNRGTEVRVELQYEAPGGALGSVLAKMLGEEPAVQIGDDLRAFKQVMETGDIMRSDTAVQSRRDGLQPAQPLASPNVRAGRM